MEITVEEFTRRFGEIARQFPSSSDLADMLNSMVVERVSAGTRLIKYNGPCSSIYLVWDGRLSASIEEAAGKVVLGDIGPGEWIGEVTLIEPGPASASIHTTEDSTLLSMSHKAFSKLRTEHPAAAGRLMHTLSMNIAERLRTYGSRAAHEIGSGEYKMEELPPDHRNALTRLIANLMGIQGAA